MVASQDFGEEAVISRAIRASACIPGRSIRTSATATLWGVAENVQDPDFHARFADALFAESGFDLRGKRFDPYYVGDLTSASSLELVDNQLRVTIWRPGEGERVVIKA